MNNNLHILIDKLIDTNKVRYNTEFNKMAKIHKYWSRKPWHIIENYVLKYSQPNDYVLDNFCGSGSVGIESILNNRHFIGYDLNPTAVFLTENMLDLGFDEQEFIKEIAKLEQAIKPTMMQFYNVADNQYILYLISGKHEKNYNCVASDYYFEQKRKINHQDNDTIDLEYEQFPDAFFPKRFYKDRFSYKGIEKVSDMFSKRNLKALIYLYNYIQSENFKYKNLLMLAFSNTLLHVSKLKAENVRPLSVNNYWIPDDYIEENVIWRYFLVIRCKYKPL